MNLKSSQIAKEMRGARKKAKEVVGKDTRHVYMRESVCEGGAIMTRSPGDGVRIGR